MPRLSFGEISHPAYLVNRRFELVWMNDAAASTAWPNFVALPRDAVSKGIFQYLLQAGRGLALPVPSRTAILRLHLGLARQLGAGLAELCRGVPPGELPVLEHLYGEVEPFEFPLVVRTPVAAAGAGPALPLYLYALNFREGVLFLYVPGGAGSVDMSTLLADPGTRSQPRRPQPPALTQVAVLVTELQDAARLWSELPPEEYFELINEIWLVADPIFQRHGGTRGMHPGEGMVCYFLPRADSNYLWNALAAAQQLREAMRRLGKDWELRKGWSTPLCLNTGLDEGLEWHGTLRPGSEGEFTVLGDAVDHAAGASMLARDGAVWATRNLVCRLRTDDRRRLHFGVRGAAVQADPCPSGPCSRGSKTLRTWARRATRAACGRAPCRHGNPRHRRGCRRGRSGRQPFARLTFRKGQSCAGSSPISGTVSTRSFRRDCSHRRRRQRWNTTSRTSGRPCWA